MFSHKNNVKSETIENIRQYLMKKIISLDAARFDTDLAEPWVKCLFFFIWGFDISLTFETQNNSFDSSAWHEL